MDERDTGREGGVLTRLGRGGGPGCQPQEGSATAKGDRAAVCSFPRREERVQGKGHVCPPVRGGLPRGAWMAAAIAKLRGQSTRKMGAGGGAWPVAVHQPVVAAERCGDPNQVHAHRRAPGWGPPDRKPFPVPKGSAPLWAGLGQAVGALWAWPKVHQRARAQLRTGCAVPPAKRSKEEKKESIRLREIGCSQKG